MDPRGPVLTLLLLVASGCARPGGEGTLEDDLGRTVDVSNLDRILPTSVDLVEILLALGHRDRIVAVPDWIDSQISCVTPPEGAQGIPQIGRPHVLNPEQVVALDPTLVLVKDHPLQGPGLAAQLEQAGLDVFVFRPEETVENLHHTVRTLAQILEPVDPEAPARAEDVVARFDAAIANVTAPLAAASGEHVPRAVFQFPAGLVTGSGTTASLLMTLAGARDAAGERGITGYKQISPETLAQADPERVIVSCTAAGTAEELFEKERYNASTAARLAPESLHIVDPGVAGLIGLRFPAGVRDVAEWLHPAVFGFITPRATLALDGRTLRADANASGALDGPLRFRLDPGDGSSAQNDADGRIDHAYGQAGTYQARLLLIDSAGRVHEENRMFVVP